MNIKITYNVENDNRVIMQSNYINETYFWGFYRAENISNKGKYDVGIWHIKPKIKPGA